VDYWDFMAERQARREANKKAWAAARDERERLMLFAAKTRRERIFYNQHARRYRGSITWSSISEWARRKSCDDAARAARGKHMPHWNPGDSIPRDVTKAILRDCMLYRGTRKLRRLGLHESSPKRS
jgi:hypothetical protein